VNSADGTGQFFEGRATQVRVSVLVACVGVCMRQCLQTWNAGCIL
jgi:hypothetical protein